MKAPWAGGDREAYASPYQSAFLRLCLNAIAFTSATAISDNSDRAMSAVCIAPAVQKVGNLLVLFSMDIPKVHELILLIPIKNKRKANNFNFRSAKKFFNFTI